MTGEQGKAFGLPHGQKSITCCVKHTSPSGRDGRGDAEALVSDVPPVPDHSACAGRSIPPLLFMPEAVFKRYGKAGFLQAPENRIAELLHYVFLPEAGYQYGRKLSVVTVHQY